MDNLIINSSPPPTTYKCAKRYTTRNEIALNNF